MKLFILAPPQLIITLLLLFTLRPVFANSDLTELFISDCNITGNYSFYSYLLFSQQPVLNHHTRALAQVEYLLRKIHKLKQRYTKNKIAPQQQHGFYIPVSFLPQSWVMQPTEDDYHPAARWILHNYDYQCSQKLLAEFPRLKHRGPYLLSSYRKLRQKTPWRLPVLTQDLSTTTLNESVFWLDGFFKKSWQPRHWGTTDILQLYEQMLTLLFQKHSQQKAASNPAAMSMHVAPVTPIDAKTHYPVNNHLTTVINPYREKLTIQLKRKCPIAK